MTQIPTSYCDRLSTWAKENQETFGWLIVAAGIAIFALGIGMATAAISIDKGHDVPLHEYGFERSPLSRMSLAIALPSFEVGLFFGLLVTVLGSCMVGQAQQKLKSPPYLKNAQAILVIIGLAVALFGIGMASGATAIHNSSQFSDPDNLRFYDSQAALDAVGTHLTTLAALGFTLIPMIGGGIAAAGLLPYIPQKIAKWFSDREDAKRKADEATATGKINLDGELG